MRSRSLGQNFLRNERTARRLAHLAGGDEELCVDLGAGNGIITAAALRRAGPVLSVELDERLVTRLRERFRDEPRVEVKAGDILTVDLPSVDFVIAANPPFNVSTKLVRRWMLHHHFLSGALIVEDAFAGRVAGDYGATKLSLMLAPFLELAVPHRVRAAEFLPQPNVRTVILTAVRQEEPPVEPADRQSYWGFVNYLFERGQRTVGNALAPLRFPAIPRSLREQEVRGLTLADALHLYRQMSSSSEAVRRRIDAFNDDLPPARRPEAG